jgi:ADP-ribosylglycohydrolase
VNPDPVLRDRLRGALLGAAIGDALGSAFEFVSSAAIERAIGGPVVREFREALPISLLAPRPPGIPTDDTAMTLTLIAALIEPSPLTPTSLFKRLVAELRYGAGRYADIFWDGGPGGACTAIMRVAESGAGPFESLNPNAGGNGAAMRAHPCGAFPDREFVADLAAMQAKLSHPHPGAVAAAQVVALIVHDGLYTGRLTTELPAEITDPDMTQAWERASGAPKRRETAAPSARRRHGRLEHGRGHACDRAAMPATSRPGSASRPPRARIPTR